MGLTSSIRRRHKLVQGESFMSALKIVFSNRKTRRAYEYSKFGRRLTSDELSTDGGASSEAGLIESVLDCAWYAKMHNLTQPQQCIQHYRDEGRKKAFSPNEALSSEGGKFLSNWGAEYLLRYGIRLGCAGGGTLSPDDLKALNPFEIRSSNRKIAVVTGIFGDYDTLLPIDQSWLEVADFFLFSDRKFEFPSGWQQVHSPYYNVDARRTARFIKLSLPVFFHDYEWVVWLDGNVLLCKNPQNLISEVSDEFFDLAAFKHSTRNSIIAEAAACARLGKENPKEISEHLARIGFAKRSPGDGLYETMAMVVRPSSAAVQRVFALWWGLLSKGSKRDQLSLPLAIAEVPEIRFAPFKHTIDQSPEFYRLKHYVKMGKQ